MKHHLTKYSYFVCLALLFAINNQCYAQKIVEKLDLKAYFALADSVNIYPTAQQLALLAQVVPNTKFQPAPTLSNRTYWDKIAVSASGQQLLQQAIAEIVKEPEVPISDEIYRRANKEGNRRIYKPRYYRTMERLEHYLLAECIENKGRFLPVIHTYVEAILAMKSWLHPNHDDDANGVLEGRRMSIDLGARRFGSDLALVEILLADKVSPALRQQIATHLQRRIIDSYLGSCQKWDGNNKWIKSTSNWNSVCTSGSVFTTIAVAKQQSERVAAIGSALNSIQYYLSGFGEDGYCSEGAGYWSYGFEHYLYLAQILYDYTEGGINLFEADNPEKLENIGNFPQRYQIHKNICAPFSDGVSYVYNDGGFAYRMSAKHFGLNMPVSKRKSKRHDPYSADFQLIEWNKKGVTDKENKNKPSTELPDYTYFENFGAILSRGKQSQPFSIAIKAGHNAENHNHSDVGTYTIVFNEEIMTGDIGAPSYIAGAFSPDNPARSSWGHPVPRINKTLQSNGKAFAGTITATTFVENLDKVAIDLKAAYEIPILNNLVRTMTNDKSGTGTISIEDTFSASEPVTFGTAIMTLNDYKIVGTHAVLLISENQQIKATISGNGAPLTIKEELVPVKKLREGAPAYRIGIDFVKPQKEGKITITYTPMMTKG